jgi:hypothetical protein
MMRAELWQRAKDVSTESLGFMSLIVGCQLASVDAVTTCRHDVNSSVSCVALIEQLLTPVRAVHCGRSNRKS